jgi:hypothetical protein
MKPQSRAVAAKKAPVNNPVAKKTAPTKVAPPKKAAPKKVIRTKTTLSKTTKTALQLQRGFLWKQSEKCRPDWKRTAVPLRDFRSGTAVLFQSGRHFSDCFLGRQTQL